MKHILLISSLVFSASLMAQNGTAKDSLSRPADSMKVKYTEVAAKFNGDFQAFISSRMKYPEDARELGQQGRVNVSFLVDTAGRVRFASVINKGSFHSLEEEALRLIKLSSGMWIPAMVNGKPVTTRVMIPVHFKLN